MMSETAGKKEIFFAKNYKVQDWQLRERQSLPLDAKIVLTQDRIRKFYEAMDGQCYIAYSGGKDSSVLRHLVKEMYPDVPAVFVNTGLEYPEVRQHAEKYADIVLKPEKNFRQVITTVGYPVVGKDVAHSVYYARRGARWANLNMNGLNKDLTESRYKRSHFSNWKKLLDAPFQVSSECCGIMKEGPMNKFARKYKLNPYIATMAEESARRRASYLATGCNIYDGKRPISKPMSVWTEQDVLNYIKRENIEIPSVYGEIVPDDQVDGQQFMDLGSNLAPKLRCTGVDRTGCMFCMFGAHLEKQPNRFQRMKITHPKQWAFCMKPVEDGGLGLRAVCDWMGIPVE